MTLSSLQKSLKIIDLLKSRPNGLRLSHISEALGYPPSTIHHILSTFAEFDYICQDPETKKYLLGFEFLRIGKSILDNLDLRSVAHEHLVRLHEKSGETVHLYILRNGKLTVMDMIPKRDGLSLASYIGWTTDPHPSAAGKVLLAGLTEREIRALYKGGP